MSIHSKHIGSKNSKTQWELNTYRLKVILIGDTSSTREKAIDYDLSLTNEQ